MKRIGYVLLLCTVLTNVGCLASMLRQEQKPPEVKLQEPPPPPPVTADGINEKNAAQRARQLREEIERDLNRKKPPAAKASAEH